MQAILSTYKGFNVFGMQEQSNLYSVIEQNLKDRIFEPDQDLEEREIEPHELRRLYQVLMMP